MKPSLPNFLAALVSKIATFKNLSALVLLMLLSGGAWGQSTANYTFATNATGSLALLADGTTAVDMTTGSTTLVAASSDAGISAVTNIGFNFTLMGNVYSQFSASADGYVGLGGTAVSGTTNGGASTTTPKISALGGDLYVGASGKIHYKLIGTTPNRCLVIEFNTMAITYSTTAAQANSTYQVRLYESNVLEFVYGAMSRGTGTLGGNICYIGFSVGSLINQNASITSSTNAVSNAATFSTNTYAASSGAITNLNSASNGSRRVYSFTPPALPTITSLGTSSGCPGSSITINGTNLTGATAVKIGGTAVSSITSNSGTSIVAVVGSGTTGTVAVTTPGGTATSAATYRRSSRSSKR